MSSSFLDSTTGWPLFLLGAFFLTGFLAHALGERTRLPRVSLILLVGAIMGPHGLGLVPDIAEQWFPLVSQLALCMVGFMLGEQFLGSSFRQFGKTVLSIAIVQTLAVVVMVFLLLLMIGAPPIISLLLTAIAPSSAPAATSDVIREINARGVLTKTLLAVVAIDDAFGIIIFSVIVAFAHTLDKEVFSVYQLVLGLWDIAGALIVGVLVGWPMATLTGRIKKGQLLLVETLGFVLLCGGLTKMMGASYLLASIVLGAMVANLAKHHTRPFHAIKGVDQPFMIMFFLLAGFSFNFGDLFIIGYIGVAYIVARTLGKLAGSYLGAAMAYAPEKIRRNIGPCLLPQAGVALGLALLAAENFPEYGGQILSMIVGTTLVFELIGPVVTRFILTREGESKL